MSDCSKVFPRFQPERWASEDRIFLENPRRDCPGFCPAMGISPVIPTYNLRLGRKSSSPFPSQDYWNFGSGCFGSFRKLFSPTYIKDLKNE